eukprot:gene23466-30938_t
MFIVNSQASNAEGNEKWAAYKGVYPKGDKSWPDWWSSKTFRGNDNAHSNQRDNWGHELRCYKDGTANRGYKMTAGNIGGGKLCSTNMYMDPMDQDGNDGRCGSDEDSWGPTWNTKQGGRCPFDDPGVYSTILG